MCGIVGIASGYHNGFSSQEIDVFYEMLFYDQLRGFDSTGVFGTDKHSNVVIHKMADNATVFNFTDEAKSFKKEMVKGGLFAVGHNRAATRGDIVDKNAHPFWVDDNIVLVQNGTWRGSHKHHHDTEVDTEALAKIIAHEPTLEDAFGKIQASFALCWYNVQEKSLNLIRNSERPLYLAMSANGALLWSSEAGFLTQACARQNLTLKGAPVMLEPYTHVKLIVNGGNWRKEERKLTPNFPKVVPMVPAVYTPNTLTGGRQNVDWRKYRQQQSVDREEVHQTAADILLSRFPEYHVSRADAMEMIQEIHAKNAGGGRKMVEITNYEPANKSPTCSTWHVFGNLIVPDAGKLEKAVCHFFRYNRTEEEIMKETERPWWDGKIVAVRTNIASADKSVVTVFMDEMRPFIMENVTDGQPS